MEQALKSSKPRGPKLAGWVLASLLAAPADAAPQAGRFSNSEAFVSANGTSAAVGHEGGRLELKIVRVGGTPRLRVTFIGRDGRRGPPPATIVSLDLADPGGRSRRISFHHRDGWTLSTTPVERLTGGSVLSVMSSHGHRIKLLNRPQLRSGG